LGQMFKRLTRTSGALASILRRLIHVVHMPLCKLLLRPRPMKKSVLVFDFRLDFVGGCSHARRCGVLSSLCC
jgi:hypothetical protein